MTYLEFKPHDLLKEYIKCFWILQRDYTKVEKNQEKVLPDSYHELIQTFGEKYKLKDKTTTSNQFLIGILDKPLILKSHGITTIIGTRLFPWGTLELLDKNLKNTFNSLNEIDFYCSTIIEQLNCRIKERKFNDIIPLLNSIFLERLTKTTFSKQIIHAAAHILYKQKKGKFNVAELAELCFSTPRTIQRNFKKKLGTTPKNYSKIIRFDLIKKELTSNHEIDIMELVYEYNFFDHAHFSKEFKKFSGETPTQFIKRIKKQKKTRSIHNVVLLQAKE